MEVRYSINGNYFKDFGVFVSASKGIADTLKRKKINSYDWAEYHGIFVDLEKPKYEAREIELQCFIVGDNWEDLFADFNKMIRDEFSKPGTQRLLIEPFGYKAMPYEVFVQDEITVDKQFREGKMYATFSIKMVEPNPLKKVLYFTGDKFDLSFNCPSETEIFYGNVLNETAQGNVSLSGKALANRSVSGYAFAGRNFARQSYFNRDFGATDTYAAETRFTIREAGLYTLSFKGFITQHPIYFVLSLLSGTVLQSEALWMQPIDSFTYHFGPGEYIIKTAATGVFHLDWITVTKGEQGATDWKPAPEDERFIVIAGNIEEITNLQTNAAVLWEKL